MLTRKRPITINERPFPDNSKPANTPFAFFTEFFSKPSEFRQAKLDFCSLGMKSSPLNSLMETAPTVESFCRKIFQREDQLNLYFSELSQNGCIQEFEIAEAFSTAKHCQISGKILRLSEDNYLLQGFFIGLDPVKEPEKNLEIKILESILASVGDAVFAYDKQGKTIFQSWRHQRWFKNPSPCARLFADELANEWGKPLKLVEELADDEGKKLYLEITRHPVKNEAGEIYAGVDIVHDITASRELEWKSAEARTIKQSQTRSVALKKIIGQSRPFKKVLEFVDKISKLDTVVFIQGDTGTGKEVIAKAIHDFSPRANKPFVAINCGALSETLLDSELFGHVKGAFTSADADSKGLFEAADGGTIFLDEIGEMSLGTQVKLLRVLQDGEVRKLGSSTSKKVDIRILTATHRNIESMIDEGKFREDLYYRIHVFTIYTPTLGERKEDIPILAEHFLKEFASRQDKIIHSISDQAIKILLKHPWPGNIRELRNVIERATVLCESNCLLPDDLLLSLARNPAYEKQSLASNPLLGDKEEYTDQKILDCLKKNHWNKTLTAKELKISRATLWRKTKEISFNP